MEERKTLEEPASERILVVGATGYIGKHIAKASAQLGHPTFALIRPESQANPAKADVLASLTGAGVQFLQGSLDNHDSLIQALKQVDVVISAVGRAQIRDQLKLVEAVKQVGHIKRFLPSEFGHDIRRIELLPPTRDFFQQKMHIQDAVKTAGIPYTFVACNCFAGSFFVNLGQHGLPSPPKDKVLVYGHAQGYFVDEGDIGTYSVKAAVDPRAENKVVYIRPARNLYSHRELLKLWEDKTGSQLEKTQLRDEDVLKKIEETAFPLNLAIAIAYPVFVKGETANFEVPSDAVEATQLYPDLHYVTMDKYIQPFLPTA